MSGMNSKKNGDTTPQEELSKIRETYKENYLRFVKEKEKRESEILENPSTKYKPQ